MRKCFLVFCGWLILGSSGYAQILTVGTGAGLPGETVTIAVTFNNDAGNVRGLQFDVACNSSLVKVTSDPVKGGALTGAPVYWGVGHGDGYGRVIVATDDLSPLPSGEIAVFTFQIVGGSGTAALALVNVTMGEDENPVAPNLNHGSIRIIVPEPDISVDPDHLDFGEVGVGISSPPRTVTVSNNGIANLTLGTLLPGGADPSAFILSSNACGGVVLGTNQSCSFIVTFHPTSPGAKSAHVIIPSDDPDENPYSLPLTGTGLQGDIAVDPANVNFFDVLVEETLDQTLQVRNDGTADITLGMISLPSPPFSREGGNCAKDFILIPGGNCSIIVRFAPMGLGPFHSSFTVSSDDPDEPLVIVNLSGTGVFPTLPDITVTPGSINFKKVLIGGTKDEIVTVRNDGDGDLTLFTIGSPASPFSIVGGTCTNGTLLVPKGSCSITVRFYPAVLGPSSSLFTITSNDFDEPSVTVNLTGKGVRVLVTPEEGTIGSEVEITGDGFGTKKGKVLIGMVALKVLGWSSGSIDSYFSKVMVPETYAVTIQRKEPKGATPIVEDEAFVFRNPEIETVNPNHGKTADQIAIHGEFFGAKKGKVYLEGNGFLKACKVMSWVMESKTGESDVVFVVPKGLAKGMYDVKVVYKTLSATKLKSFTID